MSCSRPMLVLFFAWLSQVLTCVLSQDMCNETGAVRLVGGVSMIAGRLEICVDCHWGSVCNDGFDANAAAVVCRQLGFQESVVPEVQSNVFFGGGASFQPIHLDELHCSGSEATLLNCTHGGVGVHDCDHPEDIGIICQQLQDCTDGDVRLVDGDNYNATSGRVEYCVGGLWGTVCNNRWGNADAAVVCRQLGLNTSDPKALTGEDVPQVSNLQTPIVLDGLNCRSTEYRLDDCNHEPVVQYCTHSEDAGAFCTNIKDPTTTMAPAMMMTTGGAASHDNATTVTTMAPAMMMTTGGAASQDSNYLLSFSLFVLLFALFRY